MTYSWVPINKNWAIASNFISGRWSIIAGIDSTGYYLCQLKLKLFQHYLYVLKFALHARADLKGRSKMLLLDNTTPHKSKDTKEKYLDLKLSVTFLPPFSPALSPVKVFFKQVKSKFSSDFGGKLIKFDKIDWLSLI